MLKYGFLIKVTLLGFPALLVLIYHAYLGSLSRFMADDYCSAYIASRLGLLRSIWFWYRTWSGGYATSVADELVSFGPKVGTVVIPVVLLVWLVGIVSYLFVCIPQAMPGSQKLGLAASLGCVALYGVLLLCPNVYQSFYWWGGMRAYVLSLVVFVYLLLLFQVLISHAWSKSLTFVACLAGFGFTFLDAGFSETFTPVLVVFWMTMLGLTFYFRWHKQRPAAFYYSLTCFVGSVAGLAAMVLAPGNAARQAFFPTTPGILTILSIAWSGYVGFLKNLFLAPDHMLGIVGVFVASLWVGTNLTIAAKPPKWLSPLMFISGFVFAFGCFPPSAYGMADVPPDRALIAAVFFIVAGLILSGVLAGLFLSDDKNIRVNFVVYCVAFVIIVASVAANFGRIYPYREPLAAYAADWDKISQQILAAKASGQETIIIYPLTNWAGLNDPSDNPKFFVNVCMSKYYDINILAAPIPAQH